MGESLASTLAIEPLTVDRLPDLAALFGTSRTTGGCYCMWFLQPADATRAGWSGGNRTAFEACTGAAAEPMGLLAYVEGRPVGWCAAGPRARYGRALRSTVLKGHDSTENDRVWLVPCFFVKTGERRQGLMRALLDRAVALATEHGALAVEGFPLSGEKRRGSGEAYLGVEPLFAARGFTVVSRPTPGRAVMRLELPGSGRSATTGAEPATRIGRLIRSSATHATSTTRRTGRAGRSRQPTSEE